MGKRGPKTEPTALKIAKGNPGRRPLSSREPIPPGDLPEPPDWLQGEAREHWFGVAKGLGELQLLTSIDGPAFAAYCTTWARWREAERDIDTHGLFEVTRGQLKARAAFAVSRDLLIAVNKYQREFGLTPSSRSSIEVEPALEQPSGAAGQLFNTG